MTTALQKRDDGPGMALVPGSFTEAQTMALELSKSQLLPDHFRGKPADVLLALMYGAEIGMTPINALQSIFVVKGKPGMYADAMVALVISSGRAKYFRTLEATAERATCETLRIGDPSPSTVTITIKQAESAGWTSNPKYKSEPHRMLAARAKSTLCKDVYPDVLRGMASVEELRDDLASPTAGFSAPPPPTVGEVIDVEASDVPAAPPTETIFTRLLACTTDADLAALVPEMKAMPEGKEKTEARKLYGDIKRQIERGQANPEPQEGAA